MLFQLQPPSQTPVPISPHITSLPFTTTDSTTKSLKPPESSSTNSYRVELDILDSSTSITPKSTRCLPNTTVPQNLNTLHAQGLPPHDLCPRSQSNDAGSLVVKTSSAGYFTRPRYAVPRVPRKSIDLQLRLRTPPVRDISPVGRFSIGISLLVSCRTATIYNTCWRLKARFRILTLVLPCLCKIARFCVWHSLQILYAHKSAQSGPHPPICSLDYPLSTAGPVPHQYRFSTFEPSLPCHSDYHVYRQLLGTNMSYCIIYPCTKHFLNF